MKVYWSVARRIPRVDAITREYITIRHVSRETLQGIPFRALLDASRDRRNGDIAADLVRLYREKRDRHAARKVRRKAHMRRRKLRGWR